MNAIQKYKHDCGQENVRVLDHYLEGHTTIANKYAAKEASDDTYEVLSALVEEHKRNMQLSGVYYADAKKLWTAVEVEFQASDYDEICRNGSVLPQYGPTILGALNSETEVAISSASTRSTLCSAYDIGGAEAPQCAEGSHLLPQEESFQLQLKRVLFLFNVVLKQLWSGLQSCNRPTRCRCRKVDSWSAHQRIR